MKTLISIDPGLSTGLVVGTYSDDTPFELTHAFQIEGGVEGFIKRVRVSEGEDWGIMMYSYLYVDQNSFNLYREEPTSCEMGDNCPGEYDHECDDTEIQRNTTVLVEKFAARGAAAGPFALKTNALEPLRIEGALLAMGVPITWVSPAQQYIIGGKDKAEKKKRQHAWLKDHGYYIAPKDVNETPELAKKNKADDARSATAHAISWLRRQKHKPTLDLFRKDSE